MNTQQSKCVVLILHSGDSLNSVESLIKKHEDFNRAIGLQEAKIMAIQATSDHLLVSSPRHYAEDCIKEKAEKVLKRFVSGNVL